MNAPAGDLLQREALDFAARLKRVMAGRHRIYSGAGLTRVFNAHYPGQPISEQAVRKWLSGQAMPSQDKLRVLAALFEVSPEWLRYERGMPCAPTLMTPAEEALLAEFRQLNLTGQALARQEVRQLARMYPK